MLVHLLCITVYTIVLLAHNCRAFGSFYNFFFVCFYYSWMLRWLSFDANNHRWTRCYLASTVELIRPAWEHLHIIQFFGSLMVLFLMTDSALSNQKLEGVKAWEWGYVEWIIFYVLSWFEPRFTLRFDHQVGCGIWSICMGKICSKTS